MYQIEQMVYRMTEFMNIKVTDKTHEQLQHISKVTNVPMARIISMFIEELFSLSIEYDKATLSISSRITEDSVYAVLHGYGKRLVVGKIPNIPENISPEAEDKLIFEEGLKLLKNAEGDNKEVFGES